MLKFDEFNKLVKDFSSVADFLIIYIEEAHAVGTVQTSHEHLPKLLIYNIPFKKKSKLAEEGAENQRR